MSSLFRKPEMPKSMIPVPELPAKPEVETPEELAKLMRKRTGRASTIMTGELEAMDIGKRTLLG